MNEYDEHVDSSLSTEILTEETIQKLRDILPSFTGSEDMIKNLTSVALISNANVVLLQPIQGTQQPIELKVHNNISCIRTLEIKQESGKCCAYWVDTCGTNVIKTKIICEGSLYQEGSYVYALEKSTNGKCCAYRYTAVDVGGNSRRYIDKTLLKCEV